MNSFSFIGFGEVGRTFAKGLVAAPGVRIAAYDLLFDRPQSTLAELARSTGVRVADGAADASRGARYVISAVTASAALDVAKQAAGYLQPGQI